MADLIRACRNRDLDEVKKLIRHQHDPNISDDRGNNALCVALYSSESEIALYLIEYGADPNSIRYNPALMIAAIHCESHVVNALLERGANYITNGKCALCYAATNGMVVNVLLNAGAPVNDYNYNGETALHGVIKGCYIGADIKRKYVAIINDLLQHGANPHLSTKYMGKKTYTSYDIAKRSKYLNLIKLFDQYAPEDIKEPCE